MTFADRTRLFAAFRTALLLAGILVTWKVYLRFYAIADEGAYSLNVAKRASDLMAAWPAAGRAGGEAFRARRYALGEAVGGMDNFSGSARPALQEIRTQYNGMTSYGWSAPRSGQTPELTAGEASARERTAAICSLALSAAENDLADRNRLLARTALGYFVLFLLLLAAEGFQHYVSNALFFSDFSGVRNKLLRTAAPFKPSSGGGELKEMAAATDALDRTLEASMLARIKLAKETTLRLARMKAQTKTLELTRRKVVALVEDLEEVRTDLQKEKKAMRLTSEKLARSNKELEQFAYVASHDLKEPLRIVSSFSGLLTKRYSQALDKDAKDFISYIDQGAQRATELVNALFNYSKVTYTSREFRPVDCGLALKKALFNLKIAIDEKKAEITCSQLPTVKGDEFQLIQLFQNLLANALKFGSGQAPRIRVEAIETPGEWVLKFSDNGIGIPAEHFDRIFLIFQRLHTVEKYPGAGIGLALCKKIAENHGGRIWVESKPGEGSSFFVTLPAAAAGAARPLPPAEAEPLKKAA
jgi:signal transduction histidine kinase